MLLDNDKRSVVFERARLQNMMRSCSTSFQAVGIGCMGRWPPVLKMALRNCFFWKTYLCRDRTNRLKRDPGGS